MKPFTLRAALALAILIGFSPALAAAEPQIINLPLSRPGQPVSLEIGLISAHIEVIGENRDDAVFEVTVDDGEMKIVTPSGTKTLPNAGYSFEVDEHDNKISFDTDWSQNRITVIARVPTLTNLDLSTHNDGVVLVSNVTGDMELSNTNGPVTATGISGSVIAESVNNTIDLSFANIDDDTVTSLESVNGALIVRFPENTAAQIHLDTTRGEILSDFEVDVLPSKPSVERNEDRGGVAVRIESVIIANINGGGPIIRMKSMHGDISILKAN